MAIKLTFGNSQLNASQQVDMKAGKAAHPPRALPIKATTVQPIKS